MNWLDKQTSLYTCMADNTGRPSTFREVLFTQFAIEHEWYLRDHATDKWINGCSSDLETIIDLRTQEITQREKVMLKGTMQCYTPAALLETKKKGQVKEINRTGILQLDFDYAAIQDYDIGELKQAIFSLPFIGFCGLSCSGNGFFALALIAEPHRLPEYAEHLFEVLKDYGIPPDTTKGRNVNDLRLLSYDCNMLVREDPTPLQIKRFRTAKKAQKGASPASSRPVDYNGHKVAANGLEAIAGAVVGTRWQTVQKWSYTLGGLNDPSLLQEIKTTIHNSTPYTGEEAKYCQCAEDCFTAGMQNPINN